MLNLCLALPIAISSWHGVLQASVLHYSAGNGIEILIFLQLLEQGGSPWFFSFLYGALIISALNMPCFPQHVPPHLGEVLGLKHCPKASDALGFSGPF